MNRDPETVALSYIEACGQKNFEAVAKLLDPGVQFVGPGNTLNGAPAYLAALRRIGAVWVRSEVKKVFADGPDVCVIYDLVTDTPAGDVPIVEWLRVDGGRIASVRLFFDRVAWKPAGEEAARRAG